MFWSCRLVVGSLFLSTLSLRRATRYGRPVDVQLVFLSTLSLRRATTHPVTVFIRVIISIHALLAESDLLSCFVKTMSVLFLSTLSLRRATTMTITTCIASKFLSTLSLRRATCQWCPFGHFGRYFYPRSPCGERHNINSSVNTADKISIHALLAESDHGREESDQQHSRFLSTLSLRRATSPASVTPAPSRNFYPRSPCGERPVPHRSIPLQ